MILNISLAPQITLVPKGAHPSKIPIFLKGETNWVNKLSSTLRPTEHDFEELFKKNPHPELFDEDGNLDRGDYTAINFEPGFDPEKWDPNTDITLDEWD